METTVNQLQRWARSFLPAVLVIATTFIAPLLPGYEQDRLRHTTVLAQGVACPSTGFAALNPVPGSATGPSGTLTTTRLPSGAQLTIILQGVGPNSGALQIATTTGTELVILSGSGS